MNFRRAIIITLIPFITNAIGDEYCAELVKTKQSWGESLRQSGWIKVPASNDSSAGTLNLERIVSDYPNDFVALEWENPLLISRRTVGKITKVKKDFDGLFQIETIRGDLGWIDSSAIHLKNVYVKKGALTLEEKVSLGLPRFNRLPPPNPFGLKKYCRAIKAAKITKQGRNDRAIARRFLAKGGLIPASVAMLSCLGESFALSSLFPMLDESRANRDAGIENTWMGSHGSNAVEGLAYMNQTAIHLPFGLLTGADPSVLWDTSVMTLAQMAAVCAPLTLGTAIGGKKFYRTLITAMAIGNLAGNVWEEIRIPGLKHQLSSSQFTSAGDEVHTDWEDFASGASTSLLFWIYHEAFYRAGIDLFVGACGN